MSWDAIGAIGELLGALAVVLTLAYLAKQIRNQTRANEIAAFNGFIDAHNQINLMLAADEALNRVFNNGLNHPTELNDDEASRFSAMMRAYFNDNHKIYNAYIKGAVDEELWAKYAAEAAELLESPGGRLFAESGKADSWDYIRAIREHRREESVVDLSLGRKGT